MKSIRGYFWYKHLKFFYRLYVLYYKHKIFFPKKSYSCFGEDIFIQKYFKKLDNNERSIVFVAFTAEEFGLVGSRYFGKQINPNDIVAGINIEMIGKESPYGQKTAWITGFDRSDLGEIIQKNLSNTNFKVFPDPYIKEKLFFRSDNAALAKLGIPAHTFSTTPMEKDSDYHKVSDEYKTLDIFTIKETTKLIAKGILSIIQGKDTPTRIEMN